MDKENQDVMPDHMTIALRNKRLHKTLKGMGLFVIPVPRADSPDEINYINVSCQIPGGTRELVAPDVDFPLQRTKVGKVVRPPVLDGSNVINFPTIL